MSVYTDYAEASARLAIIPSILRARADDVQRLERHGVLNGELEARVAAVVVQLRKTIAELEKALA